MNLQKGGAAEKSIERFQILIELTPVDQELDFALNY